MFGLGEIPWDEGQGCAVHDAVLLGERLHLRNFCSYLCIFG